MGEQRDAGPGHRGAVRFGAVQGEAQRDPVRGRERVVDGEQEAEVPRVLLDRGRHVRVQTPEFDATDGHRVVRGHDLRRYRRVHPAEPVQGEPAHQRTRNGQHQASNQRYVDTGPRPCRQWPIRRGRPRSPAMAPMQFGIFLPPHHVPVGTTRRTPSSATPSWCRRSTRWATTRRGSASTTPVGVELIGDPMMFIAQAPRSPSTSGSARASSRCRTTTPSWSRTGSYSSTTSRAARDARRRAGRAAHRRGDARHRSRGPAGYLEHDIDVLMHLLRTTSPSPSSPTATSSSRRACSSTPTPAQRAEIATAAIISPSGPRLVGKHGLGMISIGATMSGEGFDALALHWDIVEHRAGARPDTDRPRGAWWARCTSPTPGPGDQGRRLRHRRLVRLPPAHGGRTAADGARREHQGPHRLRHRVGHRRDRHPTRTRSRRSRTTTSSSPTAASAST